MPLNVKIERIETAETEITSMSAEEGNMRDIYMRDGTIDDVEQAALDRIKSKIVQLRDLVAKLRAEVEENKRIWDSHAGEWTEVQNKIQALQDFSHADAAILVTSQGDVTQAVTDQRWADATVGLNQIVINIDPIWTDYELQAAAQLEYDPMRTDLNTRLAGAEAAEPQTEAISGPLGQIRTNLSAIDAAVTARNYVSALELLGLAVTELETAEAEIVRVQEAKAAYEKALADMQSRLTDASVSEYQTLAEQQAPLIPLQDAMETAAAAHDYETAMLRQNELSAAVDLFLAARNDLDAAKTDYEAKLASLSGRLTAASVSEMATTAELQQNIITAEDAMTSAAEAEDFAGALLLANDVETALVAYEAVIDDRDLYEARLGAMQDELIEASVSQEMWAYLQPIQAEMATIQTEMETAASAENYAAALISISALEAKLVAFYAAIAAKKLEYETARSALDGRNAHLNECSYPLAAEKTAIQSAIAAIDADVANENWADALNGVESANASFDAFDTAHQAHDTTLRNQITPEMAALRTAADHPENNELSSAATLGQLIVQLDRALGGTADLDAMIDILDQAKQLASELERLRDIRDRLSASWDEDGTALEIFNEIKNDSDLNSLPLEARNMLVETLLDDGIFDSVDGDEQAAVQEIWASAASLDPAFEQFDTATTNQMMSSLEDDPVIQDYAARWTTLSGAERQAALTAVGDIIGGENGWNIEGMDEMDITADGKSGDTDCTTDPNLRGWQGGDEISICMCNTFGEWDPSNDFGDVIMNLTHEVGHKYQRTLIESYEAGDLSPSDEEYEQARMLSLDRRYFEEFPDDYDDWDTYVHSPMEQQSRNTANRIRGDIPPSYGSGYTQEVN